MEDLYLIDLDVEKEVIVEGIKGGISCQKRLEQLGLKKGQIIKIVNKSNFGGPILVEINGTKVAIGRGLASKIRVKENE